MVDLKINMQKSYYMIVEKIESRKTTLTGLCRYQGGAVLVCEPVKTNYNKQAVNCVFSVKHIMHICI